jgi:DNA primase
MSPKYKSSKDFPRSRTLFNYDTVTERGHRSAILVESPMSVLKAESWVDDGHSEFSNTLATFGANVSDEQIEIVIDSSAT